MSSPAAGPGRLASGPALEAIYGQLADVAHGLTEASALQPSRCAGWARMDVLYHQLMDARRALVTFATPAQGEPDTDAVSYWRPFSPGSDDPAAPDADSAARHARHVRIVASAYPVSFRPANGGRRQPLPCGLPAAAPTRWSLRRAWP